MLQEKSSAHNNTFWGFMYNKLSAERLNTWSWYIQSVDLNIHNHPWLSEVPLHSDRNLVCLHSCFGSSRDVLSLALFQPLLLGLKCQPVHEKYRVGAALDAYFPILLFLKLLELYHYFSLTSWIQVFVHQSWIWIGGKKCHQQAFDFIHHVINHGSLYPTWKRKTLTLSALMDLGTDKLCFNRISEICIHSH